MDPCGTVFFSFFLNQFRQHFLYGAIDHFFILLSGIWQLFESTSHVTKKKKLCQYIHKNNIVSLKILTMRFT